MVDKQDFHKKFIKELNNIFKDAPEDEKLQGLKKLQLYCEKYTPKTRTQEWTFPLEKEITEGTIGLLVHSDRPIRCIGIITKNVECTDVIPKRYRYVVEKMIKKPNDGEKLPHLKNIMVPDNQKKQHLLSKKKGFWIFWAPSLQAKITTANLNQNMNKVIGWYDKYVDGMFKNPSDDFPRVTEPFGEQFLLDRYPTAEWKVHLQTFQKRNTKKKPRKEEEEEEEEEEELPIPPPPPYPPPPASKKTKTVDTTLIPETLLVPPFSLNDIPPCPEEGKEFLNLDDVDVLNLFNMDP